MLRKRKIDPGVIEWCRKNVNIIARSKKRTTSRSQNVTDAKLKAANVQRDDV